MIYIYVGVIKYLFYPLSHCINVVLLVEKGDKPCGCALPARCHMYAPLSADNPISTFLEVYKPYMNKWSVNMFSSENFYWWGWLAERCITSVQPKLSVLLFIKNYCILCNITVFVL